MLSYDLVPNGYIDNLPVYLVWLDGVNPKTYGSHPSNKNHQPIALGKYAGRIVHLPMTEEDPEAWIAIPSFVEHGDPYGDIEIDYDDLYVYDGFKTKKKAVNHLRKLYNERLAEQSKLMQEHFAPSTI